MKFMKKLGKDTDEGGCMRGKDRKLGFSDKGRNRIWKNYMDKIMNKENDWDHVT